MGSASKSEWNKHLAPVDHSSGVILRSSKKGFMNLHFGALPTQQMGGRSRRLLPGGMEHVTLDRRKKECENGRNGTEIRNDEWIKYEKDKTGRKIKHRVRRIDEVSPIKPPSSTPNATYRRHCVGLTHNHAVKSSVGGS